MKKIWRIFILIKEWKNIDPSEKLARFIFSKNEFSQAENRVKYHAFLPKNDKVSVFRIKELKEIKIWKKGISVGRKRSKKLLARGDIESIEVIKADLKIDPDAFPKRHANIIGWLYEKSEIKLKAIELSEKTKLYLK